MGTFQMTNISEIEIAYHPLYKASELPKIVSSDQAEKIFRQYWKDITYVESFVILLLNRSNKVLGIRRISKGGVAGTIVDNKLIFQAALKANASAIILAHNHPSGNLTPSELDNELTRKISKAAKLLDMDVLDHLILTDESYYSYSDEGKM